jgi:hypothetical protein
MVSSILLLDSSDFYILYSTTTLNSLLKEVFTERVNDNEIAISMKQLDKGECLLYA